jgi:hypothetical protein
MAVESILRQTVRPEWFEIALASDDFPEKKLPARLQAQMNRGLRVRWVDRDLRVFMKLLPALSAFPDKPIVTADDDVLYPPTWLAELLEAGHRNPTHVIGHRGTEILVRNGGLAPYIEWPRAKIDTPSSRVFLTGVGGIYYPPGSLPPETLDYERALRLSPNNDDIWFRAMELLAGTPVSTVRGGTCGDFPTALATTRTPALRQINVASGRNDEQFDRVVDHFGLWSQLCVSNRPCR